jgi:hypothetical protein
MTPIYSETMSMKRFMHTTRFLHFTTNKVKNDAPRKIRPVLDHSSKQISDLHLPQENTALDKRLMKFRGRLPYVQ